MGWAQSSVMVMRVLGGGGLCKGRGGTSLPNVTSGKIRRSQVPKYIHEPPHPAPYPHWLCLLTKGSAFLSKKNIIEMI